MLTFTLEQGGREPLYMQIYSCIRKEIESGRLAKGEKLPSKRALSSHLKVSIITVETAYAQLMAEGYISSKPGSGYYAEDMGLDEPSYDEASVKVKNTERRNNIITDFRTNCVDTDAFPFSSWAKISREVLSGGSRELLDACHPQGTSVLRTAIAEHLRDFRGMEVSPEQIVIGAGTEYLTGLVIQLMGRDLAYGVENPGYGKVYDIFSANTNRVFPVPMDSSGADPKAIAGFGINVIHVTPSHHFPLGVVMPVSRRQELLRWAYERDDRYILEDDCGSEFRYAGRPLSALQSMDKLGRVIYINTFTRTLAPSIRIGYMVLPEALLARFRERLGFYSCTVPVSLQYTLAEFMRKGLFERHISRMKKIYRARRDILAEKIMGGKLGGIAEISGCDAGMHMLISVNNGMEQNELAAAAAEHGAGVYRLSEYYSFPVSDMPKNVVIAGYSGLCESEFIRGAEALEMAWVIK